ncbi:acyltransferase family protein [Klugiella xanthotipulae]|uniref:Peptidoglycan/LPS O-acetylase OafA/YrhL n=1 Tax=Klugiella xanthotipulae TaxID=244735 RepID=A0A543I6D2_9MICO|nr:acyltransferase [Klugiella xanthotipulae]TQM66125.1 peptidoglycan/LPS O-acetylase OafA/YrhL [Klugiella xanthotipulae]
MASFRAVHSNNLDALRLVGAVLVIVGHAFVLLGRPQDWPEVFGMPAHILGIAIFFTISGYLIWGSWERTRSPRHYFVARCLRIFPALIVVVLLTVCVIGPVVTTLTTAEYFSNPLTYNYLRNIYLFQPQYLLPGVFEVLPYPGAVNGSLWTLRAEFACYLLVPLIAILPHRLHLPILAVFAVGSAVVGAAEGVSVGDSNLSAAAYMWGFFAVGAIVKRMGWARFCRPLPALGVLALWGAVYAVMPQFHMIWAWLALSYLVLAVGLASTPGVRSAARYGDMSYGIYLWAFPVQQILLHYCGWTSPVLNIVTVTLISAVLALASWWWVEKPSLEARGRVADVFSRRPRPASGTPVAGS